MRDREVKSFVRWQAVLAALFFMFLPTRAQGTNTGPGLEWATYLGGSGTEYVLGMARTAQGEIVLLGNTLSADFPTTAGPSHSGGWDAFVAVLDASGSSLLHSTLLGGTQDDYAYDIQIGSNGNVYVVGLTASSSDFPTTPGAWQPSWGGGNWDGFLVELSPDLSAITYGSFVGGSNFDCAGGLQVRAPRVLTIAGSTRSGDFPGITPATAVQPNNAGGNSDYFLCRIDLDQTSPLQYGTYLGGSAGDGLTNGVLLSLNDPRIHEDASGVVTLAGRTRSDDIVRTAVGYDTSFNSTSSDDEDAYLAIVDPSRSGPAGLVYDTYLGGTLRDGARALAVDSAGVVTLGGWTDSPAFPTTPGAFGTTFIGPTGRHDGFLARLDPGQPQAQQLLYSTLLSGDGYENVTDLVLDASGRIVAQGYTGDDGLVSNRFTTTRDAFQRTFAGERDGFLVHLDPAGNGAGDLSYSTFLGGIGWDIRAFGLEVLYESPTLLRVVSAGGSGVLGFPTTSGAYQPNPAGGEDGLVLELEILLEKSSLRRFTGPIGSAGARGAGEVPLVAGATPRGPTPGLDRLPSSPGDPPSLQVVGRAGAAAVLWIGTHRYHDGERWLVSPNVSRRLLVLGSTPDPCTGSLDVSLERLRCTPLDTPLFAQVAVIDPESAHAVRLSPIVELSGPLHAR